MAGRDIVVIGTSAGGVEALIQLVQDIPADFPAAIFVVMHVSPASPSLLPTILERYSKLPALTAEDKKTFQPGHIYIAPPDRHMMLEQNRLRVLRGPKENRHRPAIDPLFRSAAWSHGPRVVGLVMTGMLDDGASGLWSIKTCGGVTVVQDPADAAYPAMPANVLKNMEIDYCLPLAQLPRLLNTLARKRIANQIYPAPDRLRLEMEAAVLGRSIEDMSQVGTPTVFTCPACRGSLWEVQEGNMLRYRCHVGHAFAPGSMLAEQKERIETALYTALSTMEEKIVILNRLAAHVVPNDAQLVEVYRTKAAQLEEYATQIRRLLATQDG